MTIPSKSLYVTFWRWFFCWEKSYPGYKRVINFWLCCDALISILITHFTSISLEEIANKTLLPLCSVFVGIAVSAATNGHAIVTSSEIRDLAISNEGGLEDYVYSFYIAILGLLITICYWGFLTLKVLNFDANIMQNKCFSLSLKELFLFFGLFLISLSIRLSWRTLISVPLFVLVSQQVRNNTDKK